MQDGNTRHSLPGANEWFCTLILNCCTSKSLLKSDEYRNACTFFSLIWELLDKGLKPCDSLMERYTGNVLLLESNWILHFWMHHNRKVNPVSHYFVLQKTQVAASGSPVNISDNIRRDGEFKIIKGTNYLCMKAGRLIVQISSRLQHLRFLNQSCLVAICDESNWLEVQLQDHRFHAWILECYKIINCSVVFVLFLFIMLKYSQLLWPSEHYDCFSRPLLCLRLGYFM